MIIHQESKTLTGRYCHWVHQNVAKMSPVQPYHRLCDRMICIFATGFSSTLPKSPLGFWQHAAVLSSANPVNCTVLATSLTFFADRASQLCLDWNEHLPRQRRVLHCKLQIGRRGDGPVRKNVYSQITRTSQIYSMVSRMPTLNPMQIFYTSKKGMLPQVLAQFHVGSHL